MINEGYAKPCSKYYFKALASYQVINFERKQEKRSLYSAFERFEQTVYPK
jgi:hypothetical protein